MLRLAILNFAFACFVAWATWLGYVGFIFTHDVSHISYLISALFVASMVGVFLGKAGHLERVEVWLVTLGLIANVLGFVIALQNIDIGALSSAEGVQKVAADLLKGMGTAFYGTLIGAICALWVNINAWVIGITNKKSDGNV